MVITAINCDMEPKKRNTSRNLKPFKPGKDSRRNTKGRPRKLPEIDKLLIDVLGAESSDGITVAQAILQRIANKALAGDLEAANIILSRAYGKVNTAAEESTKENPFLEAMKQASVLRRSELKNDTIVSFRHTQEFELSTPAYPATESNDMARHECFPENQDGDSESEFSDITVPNGDNDNDFVKLSNRQNEERDLLTVFY